jgi:NodT family efflux transporter outer membrane factor (OMF) lipoprotein
MKRTTWILALAALVTVGGCTVGPDYKRPDVATPGGFFNQNSGTATTLASVDASAAIPDAAKADPEAIRRAAQWWKTLNDPVLDELVDKAVVENLDVKIALSRVREVAARRGVVAADLFPSVDAAGAYRRSRDSREPPENVAGRNVENDRWSAGFDAGWEIDVWGGVRRDVEAADADLLAAVESRNGIVLTLISEVARNYVELRGNQRQIAIAESNVISQRDTLKLTQLKFEAGLSSDLDLARNEALVYTTEATIPAFEAAANANVNRLATLLGTTTDAIAERLLTSDTTPIPVTTVAVPVGLPGDLLRRRPDIRQAERVLAAETARIGVATADLFPRFTLTGSIGVASDKVRTLGNSSAIFYGFGPNFSWPVFNAGRIKFNIEAQNARQQQALDGYKQTILLSLEEVETSLVNYNRFAARQEVLQRAVDSNRRAVARSMELFDAGQIPFLDVLEAQRQQFTTEAQLINSQTAVSTALVALYKALGGGWEVVDITAGG